MATRENALLRHDDFLIHRGKSVVAGLDQSATTEKKKGLRTRKPLADLSNTAKAFGSKQTILKDRPSTLIFSEHKKNPLKKKNGILSDWDVQRCHEWGKEGIEQMHFSSNNMLELQRTAQEERVKKEVGMVVSSMRNWKKSVYDLGSPGMMKPVEDIEPTARMELEPELALRRITRPSFSGQELEIGFDLLRDDRLTMSPPFKDVSLELHVEESDNDMN